MRQTIYLSIIVFCWVIPKTLIAQMGTCDASIMVTVSAADTTFENSGVYGLCLGDPIQLTPVINSLSNEEFSPECENDMSVFVYNWGLPGGGSATTPCIDLDDYGIYTLTVSCNNGGTNESISFTITETSSLPDVDIPVEDLCDAVSQNGQMVTLTAELTGNTNNITVQWLNENDGVEGTGLTVDVSVPNFGNTATYRARVFENGSEDCFTEESIELNGTFFNPSVTINPSSPTVCGNDQIDLTAQFANGLDFVNWTNSEGNPISTSVQLTRSTGTYTANVRSDYGCTAEATVVVSSTSQPDAPTIMLSGEAPFCPTESVTISIADPDDQLQYEWRRGASDTPIGTGTSIPISQNGTYRAIAKDGECESAESNSVNVTFEIFLEPNFTILEDAPYCEGETITLSLANLQNDYSVSWGTGDSGPTTTVSSGGTYGYTITYGPGCTEDTNGVVPEFSPVPVLAPQFIDPVPSGTTVMIPVDFGGEPINTVTWEVLAQENAQATPSSGGLVGDDIVTMISSSGGGRSTGAVILELVPVSFAGCEGDPVELLIRVLPDAEEPFIPQVVSPNGDGANDEWAVLFPDQSATYNIVVYSRGGGVVFNGSQAELPWDTGDCPNGTYYYQITEANGDGVWQGALSIIGRRE